MQKNERIVRYTSDELAEMRRRGEDHTDWARFDALTEEELEASIDFEEEGRIDWGTSQAGIPGPQHRVLLYVDADVYEWFEAQGVGYKTRMNEVLRDFVEAEKQREAATVLRR